jgi:hypothetical protein
MEATSKCLQHHRILNDQHVGMTRRAP